MVSLTTVTNCGWVTNGQGMWDKGVIHFPGRMELGWCGLVWDINGLLTVAASHEFFILEVFHLILLYCVSTITESEESKTIDKWSRGWGHCILHPGEWCPILAGYGLQADPSAMTSEAFPLLCQADSFWEFQYAVCGQVSTASPNLHSSLFFSWYDYTKNFIYECQTLFKLITVVSAEALPAEKQSK